MRSIINNRLLVIMLNLVLLGVTGDANDCKHLLGVVKPADVGGTALVQCLQMAGRITTNPVFNMKNTFDMATRVCARHCENGHLVAHDALPMAKFLDAYPNTEFLVDGTNSNGEMLIPGSDGKAVYCLKHGGSSEGACKNTLKSRAVMCSCTHPVSCQLEANCSYSKIGDRCYSGKYQVANAEQMGCRNLTSCICNPCQKNHWTMWTSWSSTCEQAFSYRFRPEDSAPRDTICGPIPDIDKPCCAQITTSYRKPCRLKRQAEEAKAPDTAKTAAKPKVAKKAPVAVEEEPQAWKSAVFLLVGVFIAVLLILLKKSGLITKLYRKMRKGKHAKNTKDDKTGATTGKSGATTGNTTSPSTRY